MIWALGIIAASILLTKVGQNWKPRPPKHIREAIRRNRWTP